MSWRCMLGRCAKIWPKTTSGMCSTTSSVKRVPKILQMTLIHFSWKPKYQTVSDRKWQLCAIICFRCSRAFTTSWNNWTVRNCGNRPNNQNSIRGIGVESRLTNVLKLCKFEWCWQSEIVRNCETYIYKQLYTTTHGCVDIYFKRRRNPTFAILKYATKEQALKAIKAPLVKTMW